MTEPAAISGTFADLKSVKTRSVVQMVIEIPIEHAAQIVEAFGFPQPGAEIPVAVARLGAPQKPVESTKPEKAHKHFLDYPRSQQAAMATKDADFQCWIGVPHPNTTFASHTANAMLQSRLGITSKTELDKDVGKTALWDALYARYLSETGRVTEAR